MARVGELSSEATGRPCFICDFSPPRSGSLDVVSEAASIAADFISVGYNPGRAVRTNSPMLAATIRQHSGKEAIFTIATRDMNRLAIQSMLLGAQVLGLENVVAVQGDPFTERDLARTKPVDDYVTTSLIAAVKGMNDGRDFRDSRLREPTRFSIGATFDLARGVEAETVLALRKVRAGADYLLSQPIFHPEDAQRFEEAYSAASGGAGLPVPVFYGLQLLEQDGVGFSAVPEPTLEALAAGRSGVDIALEVWDSFRQAGLRNVYLVPPIRRGGARNYDAAREFFRNIGRH